MSEPTIKEQANRVQEKWDNCKIIPGSGRTFFVEEVESLLERIQELEDEVHSLEHSVNFYRDKRNW